MNTPPFKIAILNRESVGTNYLYYSILYYFLINGLSFPQLYRHFFHYLDSTPKTLYPVNTLSRLFNFPYKYKYYLKEIDNFFNYKIVVKKCIFEQALSTSYKKYLTEPSNFYLGYRKIERLNVNSCKIPNDFFTMHLESIIEKNNLIYDNYSNLIILDYDELKYDMDGVLKNLFKFKTTAKDAFGLTFTEISKIAFSNPKSEKLDKFCMFTNKFSHIGLRLPYQKIKLDKKIKLIKNFDDLLEIYQKKARGSNLLNYVSKKDIYNRVDRENNHYSL